MARPLVLLAAAGIGISTGCFVLAGLLSPYGGLSYPFRSRTYYDSSWWDSRRPWTGYAPFTESGAIVTREFGWTGGDSVEINIPAAVHYEPAPQWSVTAKGPESSVAHLRITGGAILFDAPPDFPNRSALEVRIKGPALRHVGLNGSGQLILENIAQDEIAIDIRGSGSVQGSGKVEKLGLRIFGSGNAELAGLATEDVDANIFGSGNADIAPTGEVEVSIFGSGDVRLHAHPRNISTKSFGSGRVIEVEPARDPGDSGQQQLMSL